MLINGGNATLYVHDLDRSIRFYTETLGLALRMRAEDHYAEVTAGDTLVIGLHSERKGDGDGDAGGGCGPASGGKPMRIGLQVEGRIETAVQQLTARGVSFDGPVIEDDSPVKIAYFTDPDGHPLYIFELCYQTT